MMMKCTVENYCHCNCSFWHLNVSVWTCKKIIKVFLYGALIVCTKRAPLRTFYTPFVLSINSSILFEYPRNTSSNNWKMQSFFDFEGSQESHTNASNFGTKN
jgi:hypothetical protein